MNVQDNLQEKEEEKGGKGGGDGEQRYKAYQLRPKAIL